MEVTRRRRRREHGRPTGRRAGADEILVSVETATAAGLDPTLDRTRLELKTKALANEVVTLRVTPELA
ncbi:MAG TPA: hypothetical protein VJZ50_11815 [Candidatus Limnocylindrales bacterium]|nr:hypothetical protein [Candidatus Limnocylindrales bacterium]